MTFHQAIERRDIAGQKSAFGFAPDALVRGLRGWAATQEPGDLREAVRDCGIEQRLAVRRGDYRRTA
jgi:hypothetical protein